MLTMVIVALTKTPVDASCRSLPVYWVFICTNLFNLYRLRGGVPV